MIAELRHLIFVGTQPQQVYYVCKREFLKGLLEEARFKLKEPLVFCCLRLIRKRIFKAEAHLVNRSDVLFVSQREGELFAAARGPIALTHLVRETLYGLDLKRKLLCLPVKLDAECGLRENCAPIFLFVF